MKVRTIIVGVVVLALIVGGVRAASVRSLARRLRNDPTLPSPQLPAGGGAAGGTLPAATEANGGGPVRLHKPEGRFDYQGVESLENTFIPLPPRVPSNVGPDVPVKPLILPKPLDRQQRRQQRKKQEAEEKRKGPAAKPRRGFRPITIPPDAGTPGGGPDWVAQKPAVKSGRRKKGGPRDFKPTTGPEILPPRMPAGGAGQTEPLLPKGKKPPKPQTPQKSGAKKKAKKKANRQKQRSKNGSAPKM